ncbi:MAG: T9SS type A sorting domain-containing protein [Lewinellaceae bacterium]|nr:T9SS type A sorting domain-containing protein [Lewinellaceae bacterium]
MGDFSLGRTAYTLNNGQDWIFSDNSPFPFFFEAPYIKLVGSSILLLDLTYDEYIATKIDMATNEVTSEYLGDFTDFAYIDAVIQDDGTVYFFASELIGSSTATLYRYRFGEGVEHLGDFTDVVLARLSNTSTNDLFAFGDNSYFKFDGTLFAEYPYAGLPATGNKTFFLSENGYLYYLIGDNRIFRSAGPLAVPYSISGSVHHGSGCDPDPSDAGLKYWKVKVESGNHLQIKTTNSEGDYKFSVPLGDYTLSSRPATANWEMCESSFGVTVDEEHADISQDFHARGLVDCAGLEVDFSTPLLRRCFDNYYSVHVRNTGPQPSEATTLFLELDPFFDFTSASIPYAQPDDGVVQFELGPIGVGDQVFFKIFFTLSCEAELSVKHCLTGSLRDMNLCDHGQPVYTECQENIGSYDPNDKRMFNEDGTEVSTVDKGEYIYYHIRFQNTGTDTAFNVRVIDPLSPKLDVNTLEMLSASHSYTYKISDGLKLIVDFEDILLPDSITNEPASHGFFKFRVKPLPEFDYGTSIPNQAAIFFDFNEPVITNEATLLIQQPVATKEAGLPVEFEVFPNPAKDKLILAIPANELSHIDAYRIINQLGQPVRSQANTPDDAVVNITGLAPGVYFLALLKNGVVLGMRRFVKM